jgi:hypothetical protein
MRDDRMRVERGKPRKPGRDGMRKGNDEGYRVGIGRSEVERIEGDEE